VTKKIWHSLDYLSTDYPGRSLLLPWTFYHICMVSFAV